MKRLVMLSYEAIEILRRSFMRTEDPFPSSRVSKRIPHKVHLIAIISLDLLYPATVLPKKGRTDADKELFLQFLGPEKGRELSAALEAFQVDPARETVVAGIMIAPCNMNTTGELAIPLHGLLS